MKIVLGKKYVDPITGFKGIAVAKTEWHYGCTRIGLQAPINQEGKILDAEWFDELQLMGVPKDDDKGGPSCRGTETG